MLDAMEDVLERMEAVRGEKWKLEDGLLDVEIREWDEATTGASEGISMLDANRSKRLWRNSRYSSSLL